jgi:hypothetical protein
LDLWKNGETVDEVIEDINRLITQQNLQYIHEFRTSIRRAMKEADPAKKLAMINCFEKEIQQLMGIQAFEGAKFEDLSEKEKGEILMAHMFGTEKKKADESFDRYKGRMDWLLMEDTWMR